MTKEVSSTAVGILLVERVSRRRQSWSQTSKNYDMEGLKREDKWSAPTIRSHIVMQVTSA